LRPPLAPPPQGGLLVALGLGSNLAPPDAPPFSDSAAADPRVRALEGALALLSRAGLRLRAASRLHETEAAGTPGPQPPYLNACALFEAPSDLERLLRATRAVERVAGRSGKGDRAPRSLDLDVLAAWTADGAGGLSPLPPCLRPGLAVPHPRLAQRAFVLVPLADIAEALAIQEQSGEPPRTVGQLLAGLPGCERSPPAMRPGPASPRFPWPPTPRTNQSC
jgi:2-amino-4-hydroxy-6-hydroxymethyldihydropteridine diphosphokinase